ncbi:hypothetical protein NDU88_002798 [Pleurodeles waltl]|uniref:Uncharacterized protein n=1 Tax=Pleurodeles waltl TaxID=8319 RepID=A0AAV7PAR1_PLEWA|nr:hypothetical protein NDU88_002798 [Pleurodeles waltl]
MHRGGRQQNSTYLQRNGVWHARSAHPKYTTTLIQKASHQLMEFKRCVTKVGVGGSSAVCVLQGMKGVTEARVRRFFAEAEPERRQGYQRAAYLIPYAVVIALRDRDAFLAAMNA